MKKLLALLLMIALALPAAAYADQDPIVGCWYICIESKDMSKDLADQGYTFGVFILCFTDGGEIICSGVDFIGSSGETSNTYCVGKWEKNGAEYKTSIISSGVDRAWFEDDMLYVCFNKVQYHGFRKMTNLNMYYNIYRK